MQVLKIVSRAGFQEVGAGCGVGLMYGAGAAPASSDLALTLLADFDQQLKKMHMWQVLGCLSSPRPGSSY